MYMNTYYGQDSEAHRDFPVKFDSRNVSRCSVSREIVSIRLITLTHYGQFSKVHVCFCGLDPGNLKFETVRTNKQHICF